MTECCFSAFIVEVRMERLQSLSMTVRRSSTSPFTSPAQAILARPSLMSAAISMMDFGSEYSLVLPSFSVMIICFTSFFVYFSQACFRIFILFTATKKVPSDTLMLSKGTMYFHSPRFHPFCFFKPLHLTITESPGRIGAAQSWSSITFLLKPLHHKTGFLSVTFAVIYSSLLRFAVFLFGAFGSR